MNVLEFNSKIAEVTEFPRPSHFIFEVEIYVGTELAFKPYSVVNCDYTENYRDEYASTMIIELAMSRGDYIRHVYPNREKLISFKVFKHFVSNNTDVKLDIDPIEVTYRAFCYDLKDEDLQAAPNISNDQTLKSYKFELIEANVYDFRLRQCGGIFRNIDKLDIVKYFYSKAASALPEPIRSKGLTVDKPNVDKKRKQIVIPHGTPLVDLPKYIQDNEGGVYNGDIGNFFSNYKRRWFVFSVFNTARHEESNYSLELFLTPPNYSGVLDRTWRYDEDKKKRLTIISTDNFQAQDNRVFSYLNQGNGIKFLKADSVFNEFSTVDSNKVTIETKHRAEFILKERESDKQVSKYTERRVTNNVANSISHLSRKGGMYFSINWKNSRPDLLVPGMPVTINYITENDVKKKLGTLHEVFNNETRVQANMSNQTMFSTSVLVIFVDDPDTEIKSM